ncbi:hypothetical protein HYX00_01065 [Candidatus Woesearchaeota archaeon]|nr:hypothetical protein [Candidatus Woesearchaeota archaeon]
MENKIEKKIKSSNKNEGKQNKGLDIHFWASFVTIVSVLFALYVFVDDKCSTAEQLRQESIHQLESFGFEMRMNEFKFDEFLNSKDVYISGNATYSRRFETNVINKLISEGKIQNLDLRANVYRIADALNNANKILDNVAITYRLSSPVPTPYEKEILLKRIKEDYRTVIDYVQNLKADKTIPIILSLHIKEINSSKRWFCWK